MNMTTDTTNVLIGIQARSNSTRFPGKIYEYIGNKRVLQHVIDAAQSASMHVQKFTRNKNINCKVAVLHPSDDKKVIETFRSDNHMLIGGNENDVLSRYLHAMEITNSDYVVRLTSDCPLILDFIITKHINSAVINKKDYVANVYEDCRSVADGFDCEILSRKAMEWLDRNAVTPSDREHVTTLLREEYPSSLSFGIVTSKLDSSMHKYSVDTPEDLEVIRKYYHDKEDKKSLARAQFGNSVYEL